MELKSHVVNGMAWTFAEKVFTSIFQMLVGLVMMNFLFPDDYGTVQILVVFTSICSVFVDSGFSAALIRKQQVRQDELSSVFLFNISTAAALYLVLLALTPLLARYFDSPVMLHLAPVLFLLVPVNSLANVQNTILTRRFDFKTISKFTLWSTFAGGVASLVMAVTGCGIWSLLGQRLGTPLVKSLLLWCATPWKPSGRLSFAPLRPMTGYSLRLLLSDITNTVYANVSELFIGKLYDKNALGFFNRAKQYKDMPVNAVISSIQNVTFPALSHLQSDAGKMSNSARQITDVMNFIMFPMMLGLIVVVQDFVALVLPERWLPVVPFFRVLCLSGLFVPVSVVSYNLLKIKSDGKLIFRLEIVKKSVATAVLVLTIPMGVMAIAWGQTIIFLSDAIVNVIGAGRYVRWPLRSALRSMLPCALSAVVMVAVVVAVSWMLAGVVPLWLRLICEIVAGAGVYLLLAVLFKPKGWRELKEILYKTLGC